MTPLNSDLRGTFGDAIKKARAEAEKGVRQALEGLAVDRRGPFDTMDDGQQSLRKRLRAHGRQLGDKRNRRDGTQAIERLVREVAYEHWHRMLFARFLAENHLLIEPDSGVAITLEECVELARERGGDPWALAASFAQGMLPQIFRVGDPALEVTLPPETRQALQRLLAGLPRTVFLEDDSLGWTYQFWQSAEKDAVNARVASGEKITGETLPAVTQLFTEPYMVKFLLHNTLGAWHAGKVLPEALRKTAASEQDLRDAVHLRDEGGYDFEYLRFVRDAAEGESEGDLASPWRPASGVFEGWPKTARELKVLDPCCGSGHFLVEAFGLLVRLRMAEEGLHLDGAIRGVIADNLLGLELDPRCTQIAAFNLALAAWKLAGTPIDLPPIRIACSGIGPQASKEEWLVLAEEGAAAEGMPGKRDLFGPEDSLLSAGIKEGLEALFDLFEKAPELGSLIDPAAVDGTGSQVDAFRVDFETLKPSLEAILRREGMGEEEVERAVAAKGMAEAARILVGPREGYTLVATNVPYLGRGAHTEAFKSWTDAHHEDAKNDLAMIFMSRMVRWIRNGESVGTVAAVTPQSWLFLSGYRSFRKRLLQDRTWDLVARLGTGAFETISGHVVNVALITLSGSEPQRGHALAGLDVSIAGNASEKAALLRGEELRGVGALSDNSGAADGMVILFPQAGQLTNPDSRLVMGVQGCGKPLRQFVDSTEGLSSGDLPRVFAQFWELHNLDKGWEPLYGGMDRTVPFGARSRAIRWEDGDGPMTELPGARFTGFTVFSRTGVLIRQMGTLPVTLYTGEKCDDNCAVLIPRVSEDLPALWAFTSSEKFREEIRIIDQSLKVTCSSLVAVPFDLSFWRGVAEEEYPEGLPEPHTDDPTQWIFHGHPAHAIPGTELQVAGARLLGYRWPPEHDSEMRLSEEARALVTHSAAFAAEGFADSDGIVCLSSIRGEASAANRLRSLLASAFGSDWSPAKERELLVAAAESDHGSGRRASSLEEWLQTSFFEEHCKLFHHRPFVWHVWDGLRDGFNALVNYHQLAGPDGAGRRTLDALTFAYLGEWIERQRAAQQDGQEGADARLAAALRLQEELKKILEGEPPYDLFVRWKPLHEQAVGWEPDINDGLRLNIRPFLVAEDVGRKGAGILRFKPNVKWKKDRGKEPESLRPRDEFPWFWGCDPEKHHEHRIDFGAGTQGSAAAASEEFNGARWNDLHYTRVAKEGARSRRERGVNE